MLKRDIIRFNLAIRIKDFGERHGLRWLVRIGYKMRYRSAGRGA